VRISTKLAIALALVALSGALPHATGLSDPPHFHPGLPLGAAASAAQDDVDAFMEKVLEKREINWDQVYNYVFGEVEKLQIRGLEIAALQSFDQEFTWYVRDGYLVRSPWKVNGVEVDDETREKAELLWIARVKNEFEDAGPAVAQGFTQSIERDSFFNFEFKPGNYLFAGREMFEGREVVRIEYYPTSLLSDDDNEESRRPDDEDEDFDEEEFEHMFEKTSLVTMLVLPEEHQILKWTFANVGFQFLPYRWLVRMDELHVSMIMDQPIEGTWLPREIFASASATTASFNLTAEYSREFGDYKEPAVGAGVVFGRPKR